MSGETAKVSCCFFRRVLGDQFFRLLDESFCSFQHRFDFAQDFSFAFVRQRRLDGAEMNFHHLNDIDGLFFQKLGCLVVEGLAQVFEGNLFWSLFWKVLAGNVEQLKVRGISDSVQAVNFFVFCDLVVLHIPLVVSHDGNVHHHADAEQCRQKRDTENAPRTEKEKQKERCLPLGWRSISNHDVPWKKPHDTRQKEEDQRHDGVELDIAFFRFHRPCLSF